MSDSAVLKKVQDMLNEEKWTRAALSAYSISQFHELDALIREAAEEKVSDELKAACDEHLSHTKTSIIALYISGLIAISRQQVDDSSIITLINLFSDNKRWNLVEFLCQRILEYGEDKNAIRTLASCYKNDNREDELIPLYERLIRVDFEEADIVKLLAERSEADGKLEEAVEYYKKALHRYIVKKSFTNAKELWNKLLELCPQDIDFFFHVQKRIAKHISADKASLLLQDLYKCYRARGEIDTSIAILKLTIQHDEKDPWARREITECYRDKYKEHSHVEEYIKLSALSSGPRSLLEAISDFEKHIAFDSGNFVFHRSWGVGRISSVEGDDITIDFAKVRGHKMSLKMAVSSLNTLNRDHIWVLKSIWKKEKLHDRVKQDQEWALKTIIRSFDNQADLKRIKAELVPAILSTSEWNSWSAQARELLKSNPLFGNVSDDIDTFLVRDRPISSDEKIFNQFKAEKNFFSRVQFFRDFLEKAETDSDFYAEMLNFFTSYLRSTGSANEQVVASFLLLRDVQAKNPIIKISLPFTFQELLDRIDSIEAIYDQLKDAELRKLFLTSIRSFISDWPAIYIRLFPYSLSTNIIHVLLDSGHKDLVREMAQRCVENYRDNREVFLWLIRNAEDEEWFKELKTPREKILINLIHIMDISFREIENHKDTTGNRKINRQVQQILFKDGELSAFIAEAERETLSRIVTLVDDVKDLDPSLKIKIRKQVSERFPDFRFFGTEERHIVSRGLLVSRRKYDEKQQLLQHILEVEVPTNSREIGQAIQLGDLRENAEYKAAKEKQEILNSTVAKLKNEIERAQIFDKHSVNTSRVSYGTIVHLKNDLESREENYTILGPWESDPAQSVISYLSPFGSELMNKKPGDELSFTINDCSYKYSVLSIDAADF